jgi:hypothetical protein
MLNIGSGLALLGVVKKFLFYNVKRFYNTELFIQTTVVCDFIILYFTKKRMFYKGVKYLLVDGEDPEVNKKLCFLLFSKFNKSDFLLRVT